jgi:hypothetical protein
MAVIHGSAAFGIGSRFKSIRVILRAFGAFVAPVAGDGQKG